MFAGLIGKAARRAFTLALTVNTANGGFISTRLLDSYNNKHERELEAIKSNYSAELEKTKVELEKAKSRFLRY